MINPYVIIAALVIWAASLAGVGYWQNEAGHVAERTKEQKKDNEELRLANVAITTLQESYRLAEHQHAEQMASISGSYQEEIKNANKKTADLIAAARTGTFRLRDPGAKSCPPAGNILPETAASTGGRDGQAGTELSGTAAEFLLGITGEADNVVRQLSACQAIVMADREAYNRN